MQHHRDQVFVSYSHQDSDWLKKLQTMLKPLARTGKIALWDDTQLQAGQKWRNEIQEAINRAKVAVLLVSPSFLASDFIDQNELPPLLKAAEQEGLIILWVAVSYSLYKHSPIEQYQAANDPSNPLDTLQPGEINRVLVSVAERILYPVNPP
jgi:ribosomal protein S18